MQLREKYITDSEGNRIGIVLDIKEYEKLLEESEELEAIRAYDLAICDDDEEIPFEQAIVQIEKDRQ